MVVSIATVIWVVTARQVPFFRLKEAEYSQTMYSVDFVYRIVLVNFCSGTNNHYRQEIIVQVFQLISNITMKIQFGIKPT